MRVGQGHVSCKQILDSSQLVHSHPVADGNGVVVGGAAVGVVAAAAVAVAVTVDAVAIGEGASGAA